MLDSSERSDGSDELLLDFPQKPRMLTETRRHASRQLAIRRAVTVASASTSSKIFHSPMPSNYVVHAREKIDLDSCLLNAELAFLACLRDMDQQDRIDTLFELFDREGNQLVDINLLKGLIVERMEGFNAAKEHMHEVEHLIDQYQSEDQVFDLESFGCFVERLQHAFGLRSFLDFSLFIAQTVAFNEDARKILADSMQESIQNERENESQALAQLEDSIVGARLSLVFSMLDSESTGVVSFTDIVRHLYHFTANMDEDKRHLLLMHDANDHRTLNFHEFCELVLNVHVAFSDNISFHDLADAMTLSLARQDVCDVDLSHLMTNQEELIEKSKSPNPVLDIEADLTYGRLQRLFVMIDADHDETINSDELMAFLRTYRDTSKELVKQILASYDLDNDGKLSFEEFASMIIKFAGNEFDSHKLIDYLCVQVALSDNIPRQKAHRRSLDTLRRLSHQIQKGAPPVKNGKHKSWMGVVNLRNPGGKRRHDAGPMKFLSRARSL